METNVNLRFCSLVLLISFSHLKGQATSAAPGNDTRTTVQPNATATEYLQSNSTSVLVQNETATNSSTATGTLSTDGPGRNQSSNSSSTVSPSVSTIEQQTTPNSLTTGSPHSTRAPGLINSTLTVERSPTEKRSHTSRVPSVSTHTPSNSTADTNGTHSPPVMTVPGLVPTTVPELHTPRLPTQAESHQDTLSHLNVGDDKQDPNRSGVSVDPLLVGLVSVFILAAAVVLLLLFLKFRRRNSQPEFRRLQDLPMDDMMEDTPLSMYNY